MWHRRNCFPVNSFGRPLCVVPWWKLYMRISPYQQAHHHPRGRYGYGPPSPPPLFENRPHLSRHSAIVWWGENEDWSRRMSKPLWNILPIDCQMTRNNGEPNEENCGWENITVIRLMYFPFRPFPPFSTLYIHRNEIDCNPGTGHRPPATSLPHLTARRNLCEHCGTLNIAATPQSYLDCISLVCKTYAYHQYMGM